jgi:high-affinity Fe2+/Pb2+ permease
MVVWSHVSDIGRSSFVASAALAVFRAGAELVLVVMVVVAAA